MRILSKISEILFGVIVLTLVCLTTSAIFGWEITQYLAYTFFISWGVFFVIEIAKTRNYYSFLLVGLAIGAWGLYLSLSDPQLVEAKTTATLLLGKISLTIFTALLGYRLFKNKNELEKDSTIFLVLLVLLVFQIMMSNVKEIDAFSVGGFVNYFMVGITANIFLNGHLNKFLIAGEKEILLAIVISNLYSISIMLIGSFL
jgi:hypothetical protein